MLEWLELLECLDREPSESLESSDTFSAGGIPGMSSSCHSSARSRPPSRSCRNKNNRKIKVLKVSVDNDHKSMIHAIKDLISVSTAGESSLSGSYLLKMCKQINKHIEQLL